MGLFGSKPKTMTKITALFSMEELARIREVIGANLSQGKYAGNFGQYKELASELLKAAEAPDTEYDKRKLRGVMYAAGCMTKLEPTLEPILRSGIEKFKALEKDKEL